MVPTTNDKTVRGRILRFYNSQFEIFSPLDGRSIQREG